MNLHDFDYLFEAYEGMILPENEDFDNVSEDVLQEASNLNVEPRDGELWIAMMPYLNFKKEYMKGFKFRPVLFLEDEEHGLVAIRCSSTKNKRPDQINKPHNLVLTKWKEYGLNEESYFVGTDARLLQYVSLREKIGQISGEVLEECRKKFNSFKEERNSAPDMLMDYLLYVSIKSPNESYKTLTMQSPDDVIKNERGNSIDISTLVYSVFSKYYIPFKIVSTNLLNNKTITGSHFWCMLMHNNRLKAFRFVSGDPSNGELYAYNTKDIDSAINYESEWLLKYFSKIIPVNRFDNYVLDEADEMQWMSFVGKKEKQSKLIDYIRSKRNSSDNFFFYHMVPKGTDVSKGLLAPAALSKLGMQTELDNALNKYRERMVKGWRIYPDKLPEELTTDELITGLEKFRGEGGARTIYFFRYPPTKILGKNMADILKEKDIYRIDLNDPEIQKFIDKVDWGNYLSNTDNPAYNKQWYENISEKDYFSNYDDNPANGMPLFASIPHIGVAFKDGICPREFLTLVTKSSDITTESVTEIPENSIEYRFEEWENGETNLLFITGLSGSGKSTLAQKLVKEFNCDYYEIDFWGKKIDKQHPGIESLSKEERRSIRVRGVIDYALKKNRRCIIEGAQIVFTDPNWYKPYSLIVVGTSLLVSTYRMIKRGFTDREREAKFAGTDDPIKLFLYTLFTGVPHNIQWNRAQYSVQKEFEKHFIEESANLNPGDVVPGYPTQVFVRDLGDGSYCFDDTQLGVRMRTLNDKENGYTTDNLEANFASYIPTSTEVVDENIVEEAHKYIQEKLTYEEVKKNMTFIYDDDGIPNGVYEINGEKYRVRVETIVKREVNGTSCIFFEKKKEISHYGSMYKIPGGSVEPDKTLAEQAECEVNEEILCKVKNVNYTGKYYIVKYDPKTIPEWHKRILWPLGLKYVGAVTFVFTAEYDGPYRKKVAKVDQDSLAVKGDWYPVWEFEEIKADIHQGIALESMEVVEESDNSSVGTKIIPVDLRKYNKPGTRVLCFNPHITKTMAKALGRTAKNAIRSSISKRHEGYFMYDTAWDGFDLFMQYSKSIMAVDIVSVNDEQCLTADLDGFPVVACESGKVVHTQDGVGEANIFNRLRDTVGPEGNTVIIAHDNKTVTLYTHLQNNSITVRKGDTVHKGQVIGKVGNTGDCTIPHLHFETSGTTWKDAGIGRQHVGFAPFMCTDVGIIDAFKKSTYDEAYKTPMEINDTGVFGTAFFLTNDPRYVKESTEVVAEGFFSSGKKNIIPLDLDEFQLPPGERVICMNTHILNATAMYSEFIKEKIKSFKSKYGDTFFGFVRSIPDFCKAIKFVAGDSLVLRDQLNAVDFISFKRLKNSETVTNSLLGCPVIACNDGTIVAIVNKDGTYETQHGVFDMPNNFKLNIVAYGNAVIIVHDDGSFYSMYGHLIDGSIKVKLGEKVKRGQHIAKLGNTGNSSGPHLHFEMFYNTKLLGVLPKNRTNFEPYECTVIEPDFKPETLTKEFYEEMKLNESGELHWCCFLTDPPIKEVKEMLEVIEESAKQFKSSKAKNFNDFCNECKTPEDAMNWFIANKVVWNDKANDDYMRWPDTLVQERKGNCLDQSVMMHFFFKRKHIEHRLALFTIRLENGTTAGHIFPLFKRGKFIYAWLYIGPGNGIITGPYRSWYDAAGMVTEFYKVLLLASPKKGFDAPISDDTEWSVQEYSETEHFDKYLDKKIIQKDYLYGDGGDNLWSTHFFSRDFHFIRIPKVTGVMYKLIAWSKQYQTPKEKKLAKEALELIKSGGMEPVQEAAEEPIDVKNVVPMGICDYVLQYLGNTIDIQKFADIKSGRRFMYTHCTVMKKHIPLILLLSYCEGLTTVLRKAEVNFFFTDTRPRLKEYDSILKGVVPFADGYLVYDKFPLEVSLLMNGLALVDTKGFEYAEMDGKDVYVSLFDILFGTRMLANAFDNFYDWMIDPVTYTVLQDLNYPTDFVGLLLAGNKLLADNSYTDELDMRNYRIRSNEMAYAYAFKRISEAYGKFRMTSNNKNPDKISIPQGSVIKDIMQSQMVEDVSELSPIVEVEKSHTISDKG